MRQLFICLLFLSSFNYIVAQDTTEADYRFSLEDCITFAFANSYMRQSMKLSEQSTQEVADLAKYQRYPNLSASLNEGFNHSNGTSSSSNWNGSYGLSSNVTLYQGGAITHSIEQSKLQAGQAVLQTRQYDQNLVVQILQAFLSVLGNQELLKYQEAVVITSDEQLKQGESKWKVGSILESDYLLLNAQDATAKSNVVNTKIAIVNSLITLKNLLSMDPMVNLDILYPADSGLDALALLPSQEIALQKCLATSPTLKLSENNIDIATNSLQLAKSGYYPTLSLGGSVGTGHSINYSDFGSQLSDNFNQHIGLTLSIPIFDNFRTKSQVAQNKAALIQAELSRKDQQLSTSQMLIQEYQNVISFYSQYKANDISQDAYFKTYMAYKAKFDAGAATVVDLLQQQNNYLNALNSFIQSKYGFLLNRKILDVYMGEEIKL
ncbi:MAG: TolC family protein [Candidatus Azobacteroides sp.]|nr:TolC family protein [Candidatus Azobacteroides sp.]